MKRVCVCMLLICVGLCPVATDPDPGQPLYLTPYIEAGKTQEAREAARVDELLQGLVSYSGYLTVNKTFDSNLFFWFFPCEHSWESRPVLLWLQGGPGASSLLGLLFENGPIRLTKRGMEKNPYSWSKNYNVIYMDNPVGAGFSFTNCSDGYPTSQQEIGRAVYDALHQFFTLFSEIDKNPFYLTGESYAGKYIPSVALTIHLNNKESDRKINLKGLFIGNGMVDPVNMLHYGEYLYQLGLIDSNGRTLFQKYENDIKKHIEANQWIEATDLFSDLVLDYVYSNSTIFTNLTGLSEHYNYVNDDEGKVDFEPFVSNTSVRKALHVGKNTFYDGKTLASALQSDIMKSVKNVVETLLEAYDILFYNGQLDIICAYPLSEAVLLGFDWSGKKDFKNAQRKIWTVNDDLAGYCKSAGKLTEVMVRNAGHLVPADQPVWALQLLDNFITGQMCK